MKHLRKAGAPSGAPAFFHLSPGHDVDERLSLIHGRRPARLRVTNLPEVARAIVAFTRRHAKSAEYERHGVAFVHLFGIGVDVTILNEDWKKIVPYFQDGTFNPAIVPVGRSFDGPNSEASIADVVDPDFYRRVLHVLQQLFTEDFPTSNL
jgi:hypothetical protein